MSVKYFLSKLKNCDIDIYAINYALLWSGNSDDILPLQVVKLDILDMTVFKNRVIIRVKERCFN